MADELARHHSISPIEVEDTSHSFGAVSPRHNSAVGSIGIAPDSYDPNGARQSTIQAGRQTEPMIEPDSNPGLFDNDGLPRGNSPPIVTAHATESRLAVTTSDRGNRSDTEGLIARTLSERGSSLLPTTMPRVPPPVEDGHREPWWNGLRLRWASLKKRRWVFVLTSLLLCLTIALVVVIVLWKASESGGNIRISLSSVTEVTLQQSSARPRTNSGVGATTIDLASIFSSVDDNAPETIVAYIDASSTSSARLCIRKKSGAAWLTNVQCITSKNVNPKPDSPISVLDWIGGPSIFFITVDNTLSGVDYVPHNVTWKLSSVAAQGKEVNKESKLASVTWLNGTSAWIYYQDADFQIREFGIDDYRDESWRDGSVGPLGLAQDGTGIGASRWMDGGSEVMEILCQATNGALHGRVYRNSVWLSDFYSVDGTPGTITQGASMTATTVNQKNGTVVLLAYVDNSGFLTVQSRETANISTVYSGFSTPKRLVEGDGKIVTGLAAVGMSGEPKVYFVVNQRILELSATDVATANWTTVDVTSV